MTSPVFDPATFGGQASSPPVPMVVCWDDLPADAYSHALADLGDWIGWLRGTYRIPATVIPPCWFTHPALREDIGHLWTGWLLTRHPDAGVGMIGLDWDQRREAAVNRLREATAITGCTATRHQAEPEPAAATPPAGDQLWHDHLDQQTRQRIRAAALQAAADVVTDILQAAELRHDLAPAILADTVENPAGATDQDREQVAQRLQELAAEAVDRAAQSAADAARTVLDAQQHTACETVVADERRELADLFAREALAGETGPPTTEISQLWLDSLEQLLPAAIAAERAAAAASTRATAVDQRASARRRHPDIGDLLQ
ncbi:hypothetical protein [Nakamurella sp.]|uniref:hypothetical protein n=1 Tax=Nakamurella sp. TaxID=1869182 RepID=UPI003B3B55C6